MDYSIVYQGGLAVAFVHLLEWMKRSNWFPWLTANSDAINRWVGLIAAAVFALGVKISIEGTAGTGWQGHFAIPSVPEMVDAVTHFAIQYGGQQGYYGLTQVFRRLNELSTTLEKLQPQQSPPQGKL